MEASRTHLEKIVELLEKQTEMMARVFDLQEEANEREREKMRLATVGREPSSVISQSLPSTLRPDMGQMDETAGADEEQGWIDWVKENLGEIVASGFGVKKLYGMYKRAGGIRGIAGRVLSRVPGVSRISNMFRAARSMTSRATPLMSRIPGAGAVGGVLGGAARLLSRGPVLAAADVMLNPTELGTDPQEQMDRQIFDMLEQSGESALPAIRELLSSEQGTFLRQAFPRPEYDILMNDDEAAREFARSRYKRAGSRSNEVYYGDSNALINRMIRDYTTTGDGFAMSPDDVRMKLNSPAAIAARENIELMKRQGTPQAGVANSTTGYQPPAIVGGPTNINNGGNVTNIYNNGGTADSLSPPTMMYNLPLGVQ